MDRETVRSELQGVFRDLFADESIELSERSSAADIQGWDSLNNVRILVMVEKTFSIRFSSSEITGLANIRELINVILRKQ
jgi:acyl carrier protein